MQWQHEEKVIDVISVWILAAAPQNTELLYAMLAPCLRDLSKHNLKQVPEDGYRNLNSAFSEWTEYIFNRFPSVISHFKAYTKARYYSEFRFRIF